MSKRKKSGMKRIGLLLTMVMVFSMVVGTAAPAVADSGNHDVHDHTGYFDGIKIRVEAGSGGTINSPGGQQHPSHNETWSFSAEPDMGYRFDHWTYNGNEVSGAFSANGADLGVTFTQSGTWIDGHWEGFRYVVGHWDYAEYKAQAVFVAVPQYELTTGVTGNGSISKNPNKTMFYEGESVTLTANPDNGWKFTGWSDGATDNPITIVMDSAKSVSANFEQVSYSVTLDLGSGGTFDSDGSSTATLTGYYGDTLTVPSYSLNTGYDFKGWSGSLEFDSNKTINAKYEYQIAFQGNEHVTIIGTNPVWTVDHDVSAPSYTVDSGYRFDGWDKSLNDFTAPTTVTANPAVQLVTVALETLGEGYLLNEGSVEGTYDFGTTVNLNNAIPMSRFGWAFKGWRNDGTGQMIADSTVTINEDSSYTAVFIDVEYLGTSAGDHGSLGNDLDGMYEKGEQVNLNDAQPTGDTGYELDCWREFNGTSWGNYDGYGALVALVEGQPVITIGNQNLFRAFFKLSEYTVSFEENGGSYVANQTVTHGQKASKPTVDPTRTGYDFSGWYSDEGLTVEFDFDAGITGDTTIYAKWIPHTYTVVYNANTGTGTTAPSIHTYDIAQNLTANAFSKEGCLFDGWATSLGGPRAYSDGESVLNLTFDDGAEVNLYARWIINNVTVDGYTGTFDGLPHSVTVSGTMSGDTVTYGTDGVTYDANIPSFTDATSATGETVYVKVEREGADTYYDSAVVTINKADAIVDVHGVIVTYDGNPHGATGTAIGADGSDLSSLLNLGNSYTDVPGGTADWSFPGDANHNPAHGSVEITINKATLAVKADSQFIPYAHAKPNYTVSYSGFMGGDDKTVLNGSPSLTCSYDRGDDAGSYPIKISQNTLDAANYDFTFSDGTLHVRKASLTVTADNKSVTYGSPAPAYTASFSGFINGDDKSDLSGSLAFDCSYKAGSPVSGSPYTITPKGLSSNNYTISYGSGLLTVNAAARTAAVTTVAPTPAPTPSPSPTPTPQVTPAPSESAAPPADTGGDDDTVTIDENDVPAGTASAKGTGFFSHWWSWMVLALGLLLLLLVLLLILSRRKKGQEQH